MGHRGLVGRRWRQTSVNLASSYARRRVLIGWIALALGSAYALAAVSLERFGLHRSPGDAPYDAIVVAGCGVRPDGTPSPALAHRAKHAVMLFEAGHAERVVFTGGVGTHPPSEAKAAAAYAIELGLPLEATLLEDRSTSTEENARFAAELIGADARVLVVSDGYHVFRCERVFGRYFREVRGSGARGRPAARARGAFREVVAVAAYGLLGRL